ncbi:MAG: ribosome maturation factor RimP [Methylococcales bacterium]|nr:ribosome maturation factor RimP [Methylococcales bacterium]MBT7408213.1 ribosome maturation factor RimP [Methylococcales bacterium]
MKIEDKITEILQPVVCSLGYELVGIEFISAKSSILRIFIDSEKGINVDDCQKVSNQVSATLDVEDPIPYEYILEVSSPGINRPIFSLNDYSKFIDQQVRIKLYDKKNGKKNFKGIIKEVLEDNVLVDCEGITETFNLQDIKKANLIIDY